MGGAVPAMVLEKQAERERPKAAATASVARADEDALRRGLRGRRLVQGTYGELGYLAPLGANPARS
jgi:hypothetical protein